MTWAKSHLRAKFKHSFQQTLHPPCSCGKEVETTSHFLLSCLNYYDESSTFQSKFRNINPNILENAISQITLFSLYGDKDKIYHSFCIDSISYNMIFLLFIYDFRYQIFNDTTFSIFIFSLLCILLYPPGIIVYFYLVIVSFYVDFV